MWTICALKTKLGVVNLVSIHGSTAFIQGSKPKFLGSTRYDFGFHLIHADHEGARKPRNEETK